MHSLRISVAVVIGLAMIHLAGLTAPAPATGQLTIEKLIDIKHPSSPVWSRDSKRVAFIWERAGVADLYVVPADGSSRPVAITSGGAAPNGIAWSADSKTLYFNRAGQMMQVSADGGEARPAQLPGRAAVFSRDGSKIAYFNGQDIYVRNP